MSFAYVFKRTAFQNGSRGKLSSFFCDMRRNPLRGKGRKFSSFFFLPIFGKSDFVLPVGGTLPPKHNLKQRKKMSHLITEIDTVYTPANSVYAETWHGLHVHPGESPEIILPDGSNVPEVFRKIESVGLRPDTSSEICSLSRTWRRNWNFPSKTTNFWLRI